ncbi:MAG: glycosyltransferase family 4 protein [Luteibaculaceae bacterium]
MKILHTQKINKIAGSENYLLNILPALKKRGIEISFLILCEKGELEHTLIFKEKLEQMEIPVYTVEFKEKLFPLALGSINGVIKRVKPDIVNTHLIHADLLLAATKFLFGGKWKLVSGKHGYDQGYNATYGFEAVEAGKNFYYKLAKWAEKQVDCSFTISHGLYNLYTGLGISKSDKLKIIKYGFDFDFLEQEDSSYKLFPKQICMVGRLTAFKGHPYAFEAIKILSHSITDFGLVVVGDGEEFENLKQKVAELKMESHIKLLGYNPKAKEYMRNSDIIIAPSIAEGFGVIVLEAFSQKKCMVTFDVPAFNENIIHTETGWLVEPYNVEKFAEALAYLLQNPEQRNQIGENAYKKLKEYYTLDRMTQETVEFYEAVSRRR